ncbi:MAG: hypothetical protein ACTSR8_03435 [Promethearchaeota archaeon]
MSKFIDFDKGEKIFYDNLYLEEVKMCVKIPLCSKQKRVPKVDVKIKKFNPAKYTYILTYEDK